MGTSEGIFGLCFLFKNYRDLQKDVYIFSIEYEKTYGNVELIVPSNIVSERGQDNNNIQYRKTQFGMVGQDETNEMSIQRGLINNLLYDADNTKTLQPRLNLKSRTEIFLFLYIDQELLYLFTFIRLYSSRLVVVLSIVWVIFLAISCMVCFTVYFLQSPGAHSIYLLLSHCFRLVFLQLIMICISDCFRGFISLFISQGNTLKHFNSNVIYVLLLFVKTCLCCIRYNRPNHCFVYFQLAIQAHV